MKEYLGFAVSSIGHRKLRSWLTIVGIIIGIGAIVALISVSQGLENAVTEQFEKIGSNRIFVTPKGLETGSYKTSPFSDREVEIVEKVVGVDWVNPFIVVSGEGEYGNEKKYLEFLMGINPDGMGEMFEDYDVDLEEGRFLIDSDKYSAVVGNKFAHDLFDKEIGANNRITIKDKKFRIVGVFELMGSEDDDYSIYIPMDTARELFDKRKEITMIDLKVKDGVDINTVAERIERRLDKYRDKDDYLIMTPDQIMRQFGEILTIIQVVLGGIAAISLLVGAVGIMNSMYTNVLERTREIGIMKSIGATNNNIMMMFLVEAALIGFLGGFLGIVFGSLLSFGVGEIAKSQGFLLLKIEIEWLLLIFSLSFAVIVGAISGYLPARQAAKLNAVDAINY
jgi:putative ABC transport system permease protein